MARWTLIMVCLLTACAPKTPKVATPVKGLPSRLAVTQISMATGAPVAPPAGLSKRLETQLKRNGYAVTTVPVAGLPADFARRRLPAHRAAAIGEHEDGLVVLVESVARFYSQLQGQYRWEVSVEATLMHPSKPAQAIVERFKIPVFLRFQHEREPEALSAAGAGIERKLQHLLDDVATLPAP
jgi:hypothetical protein